MPQATTTRSAGFTLIELVISLAIVATLTALAVPGYRSATYTTRRLDAQLALLQIQIAQEQYYSQHFRFAPTLTAAGNGLGLSTRSAAGDYDLALNTPADGQSYLAVATPNPAGRQRHDVACMQFSIDAIGRRRSANLQGQWLEVGSACWR